MEKESKETNKKETKNPTCGIIMPIGTIDNCTAEHWIEVLNIIKDVCEHNNFKSNMVNEADDIGIIHKRIVENIYNSDIIICDVSCKNANVMFELGMRLAFDKPTIIIKDDATDYSFDTSLIEHLEYRRDLRFNSILNFKENLGKKLKGTYEKSKDPSYSTFLKNFGKYKVAHLEEKEVSSDTFVLEAIEDLRRDIRLIRNTNLNEMQKVEKRIGQFDLREDSIKAHRMVLLNEAQKLEVRKIAQEYMLNNPKIDGEPVEMYRHKMFIELQDNTILRNIARSRDRLEEIIRQYALPY